LGSVSWLASLGKAMPATSLPLASANAATARRFHRQAKI
jgi:hypothetical protein